MLDALITSKTRLKLLLKFFLNSENTGYLRSLETEFGESTNAIRYELNKFTRAGLLVTKKDGNKKIYRANTAHPLFPEINSILLKDIGIDEIIDKIVSRIGQLEAVYLIGDFARGKDAGEIELWFIGHDIEENYLKNLINKTQKIINRKIKYLIFATQEIIQNRPELNNGSSLLLWEH